MFMSEVQAESIPAIDCVIKDYFERALSLLMLNKSCGKLCGCFEVYIMALVNKT